MRKILVVYDVSYPHVEGGGQRRMYEVAKRLIGRGYSVDWLCFKTWDGEAIVTDDSGIRYIGIPGYRGLYRKNGSRRVLEPVEFLMSMMRSQWALDQYQYIWSGQWPMLHLVWWLVWPRSIAASKLVVDWWEVWGRGWLSHSKLVGVIGYFLEKALISRISKRGTLVLIAPVALRRARQAAPSGNLVLIHNGIDLASFEPRALGVGCKYDVAYVGRLKNHKRVDLLLEALHTLKQEHRIGLSAIIIGDGPESSLLREQARVLDLLDQVEFTGAISSNSRVRSLLASAGVFVNPSVKEGGGSITLLEAHAAGLPVVAFECRDGIDPDLVMDGVCGVLVRTVSSKGLSEALLSLFSDPDRMEQLRRGALQAARNYDWSAVSDQYEALFRS